MLLAVDIGNTNIVCAVFDGSTIIDELRIESTPESIDKFHKFKNNHVGRVIISSVVPKLTEIYSEICTSLYQTTPFIVKHNNVPGIILDVDVPSQVGADRICNSVAVGDLFELPCVVVDSGTAVKFDVIDDSGAFIGGAIAPGMDISGRYLFEKAALLRETAFTFPKKAVGRNTDTNLQSGIMFSAVDAIDGMLERIENEMGLQKMNVVLTGGFSTLISHQIQHKHTIDVHLTLRGLEIIYNRIHQ